jgi:hydrogenase nickel incorporation protein HypA/HybF
MGRFVEPRVVTGREAGLKGSGVMNEAGLILSLIRRVERASRTAGAVRVSAVRLKVGECAGVETRRLYTTFERLSRGTVVQGAMLTIERVRLESRCDACGSRFPVVRYRFECPNCGSRRTRVVAGEEFVLESVTVVNECDPSLGRLH